ncbi:MAG: hypothetical protein GF411_10320 [Candidatus Lokiarchaeota archaeon]|nr:hypothetical protein [Candidatus Lokiarchaeota archaeon]
MVIFGKCIGVELGTIVCIYFTSFIISHYFLPSYSYSSRLFDICCLSLTLINIREVIGQSKSKTDLKDGIISVVTIFIFVESILLSRGFYEFDLSDMVKYEIWVEARNDSNGYLILFLDVSSYPCNCIYWY